MSWTDSAAEACDTSRLDGVVSKVHSTRERYLISITWCSGLRLARRGVLPSKWARRWDNIPWDSIGTRPLQNLEPTLCNQYPHRIPAPTWQPRQKPPDEANQQPWKMQQPTANAGLEPYIPSAIPIVGWPGSTKKAPDLAWANDSKSTEASVVPPGVVGAFSPPLGPRQICIGTSASADVRGARRP